MKPITFLLIAWAIGLLPATLGAQANSNGPVNYYAEFADLMHGEMDAKVAPVATAHTNRFPAFVHYREVMKDRAEDFLGFYEKMAAANVPPAEAVFANWAYDRITFTPRPVEDCSGR
jgi:hypothetical protein